MNVKTTVCVFIHFFYINDSRPCITLYCSILCIFFIPVMGFLYNKQYMKSLMEGCRGKKMTKSGLYIKK